MTRAGPAKNPSAGRESGRAGEPAAGVSRRRRPNRIVLMAVVSLASALLALRCGSDEERQAAGTTRAGVAAVPEIVGTIRVGGFPAAIAAADGIGWVAVPAGDGTCRGIVYRIDAASRAIDGSVAVDVSPKDIALGAGSLWVAGDRCSPDGDRGVSGAVLRLDSPGGEVLAEIETGGEIFGITAGRGQVWASRAVNSFEGELIRIDPERNQVAARIPVEGRVRGLDLAGDLVWLYDSGSGFVRSFDTRRNAPTGVSVPTASPFFAAGADALWVEDWLWHYGGEEHATGAVRLEPATGQQSAGPLPIDFSPIALGRTGVWFLHGNGDSLAVAHLDGKTLTVDAVSPIDAAPLDAAIDEISQTLWIANYQDTVTLIDLAP